MPKIYDNIETHLSSGLIATLESSHRSDFCVGYFNLRGWKHLENYIDRFSGQGDDKCRLLIGMQKADEDILKNAAVHLDSGMLDNPQAVALKKQVANSFRQQLTFGVPTGEDELTLRRLKQQLLAGQVVVKLFLRHTLHAKLYLLYRQDKQVPLIGYVGSSNLTLSGLSLQGELNVDVVEQDAAEKLRKWFEERWNDRWCLDITKELTEILEESWAGEKLTPPYYVYLKVAYHLSQEARSGINDYIVPKILQDTLLKFQINAAKIAARHLDKRGGVLIGDVVGFGKTLTATTVAKLFEETFFTETLIICPKNLVEMWEGYVHTYQLRAKVQSISMINDKFLEKTRRYRVVIIDESHNLRNRESKRWSLVREYIETNDSRVILLTATPYNKSYLDISNQLRLFLDHEKDLGISPERFVESCGGPIEFVARYQYQPNTLLAFEKSHFSEDWQELLKMYMVRRTRTFIKDNYALWDASKNRHFLEFSDGRRSHFTTRVPKKVEYEFDESDPKDLYVKMYSQEVVDIINTLHVARYGLGRYVDEQKLATASDEEKAIVENLSRAGRRLMGFCRTNLFKRLESSGWAFLISLARHALRNYTFIHAIDHNLPFPIGPQEAAEMDEFIEETEPDGDQLEEIITDETAFKDLGKKHYKRLQAEPAKHDWIASSLFQGELREQLLEDARKIIEILKIGAKWNPSHDKKLNALEKLLTKTHKEDKILVFTQFADTAEYLQRCLKSRGVRGMECVTGNHENPTEFAHRFSPKSNRVKVKNELRVLISTDVLSEGQNLQDSHIVLNYDLPWALIRLVQRAGRVDRLGQESDEILCYSFLPHDGLDRIIRLRKRLTERITQNAEVVGSDEVFFDGDPVNISDLYNEKAGILDEEEGDVDLTSEAYEIWNHATRARPELKKIIPDLPPVTYATKPLEAHLVEGESVVTYHRSAAGFEMLTWINTEKKIISQNQSRILKALACDYDTKALPRMDSHHDIVSHAVEIGEREAVKTGGQLGSQKGARYKAYMMLQRHFETSKGSLFQTEALKRTIDDIYRLPLRETAKDILNKRIRLGISDKELANLCIQLREEGRLCVTDVKQDTSTKIAQIICSMGIKTE